MRNRCSLARRSSIPNCIASLIHFRTSGSCGAQPERSCVKSTIVGDKDSAIRDGFAENLKTQTFHHHKHLTPFNQEVTDSLTQDLEWIRMAAAWLASVEFARIGPGRLGRVCQERRTSWLGTYSALQKGALELVPR